MKEKKCAHCGEVKNVSEFRSRNRSKNDYYSYCRPCASALDKKRWHKNLEENRKKKREYYRANREKAMARNKVYAINNKDKIATRLRRKIVELRNEVFAAYGGKCECCGDEHFEFLTIDHINGNGKEDRKKVLKRGGHVTYRWLRDHGFPKDNYRLLCYNCNFSRGQRGYCPHEKEKKG